MIHRETGNREPETVHFGFATRTVAFAPGNISTDGFTNSACTSIVPLAGSTTGLTTRTCAIRGSFGDSDDITVISCDFAILPAKYSGSVNCTFTGLVAVT